MSDDDYVYDEDSGEWLPASELAAKQNAEIETFVANEAEAEAGMAQMSEKYREAGSELYLPAAE